LAGGLNRKQVMNLITVQKHFEQKSFVPVET